MEDWWLVRDAQGRTGWLLSRAIDSDIPEAIANYAEGQRYAGIYILTTVHDDGAEEDNKDVPIYLTVLSAPAAGLPFDFNQVRVFTWNLKKHRYETAYRDKNIEGYLPVSVTTQKDPYGKSALAQTPEPTFTYRVLAAGAPQPVPNPVTGEVTPGRLIAKTYRLEGNVVRRLQPPGAPKEDEAHPEPEQKKEKAAKARALRNARH
jgi:hypothetical protein